MDWSEHLEQGERVRREVRPAPRCFTFRNWRHSLFGLFLLILALYWQIVGFELAQVYDLQVIAWIPLPVLAAALYLSLGHLFMARMEWEKVFYAVTDRRVLVLRGKFRQRLSAMPLDEVTYFQIKPFGENLGTVRIAADPAAPPLILHCIEQPRMVTDLLEREMKSTVAAVEDAGEA